MTKFEKRISGIIANLPINTDHPEDLPKMNNMVAKRHSIQKASLKQDVSIHTSETLIV
jgi:hypothetical protein